MSTISADLPAMGKRNDAALDTGFNTDDEHMSAHIDQDADRRGDQEGEGSPGYPHRLYESTDVSTALRVKRYPYQEGGQRQNQQLRHRRRAEHHGVGRSNLRRAVTWIGLGYFIVSTCFSAYHHLYYHLSHHLSPAQVQTSAPLNWFERAVEIDELHISVTRVYNFGDLELDDDFLQDSSSASSANASAPPPCPRPAAKGPPPRPLPPDLQFAWFPGPNTEGEKWPWPECRPKWETQSGMPIPMSSLLDDLYVIVPPLCKAIKKNLPTVPRLCHKGHRIMDDFNYLESRAKPLSEGCAFAVRNGASLMLDRLTDIKEKLDNETNLSNSSNTPPSPPYSSLAYNMAQLENATATELLELMESEIGGFPWADEDTRARYRNLSFDDLPIEAPGLKASKLSVLALAGAMDGLVDQLEEVLDVLSALARERFEPEDAETGPGAGRRRLLLCAHDTAPFLSDIALPRIRHFRAMVSKSADILEEAAQKETQLREEVSLFIEAHKSLARQNTGSRLSSFRATPEPWVLSDRPWFPSRLNKALLNGMPAETGSTSTAQSTEPPGVRLLHFPSLQEIADQYWLFVIRMRYEVDELRAVGDYEWEDYVAYKGRIQRGIVMTEKDKAAPDEIEAQIELDIDAAIGKFITSPWSRNDARLDPVSERFHYTCPASDLVDARASNKGWLASMWRRLAEGWGKGYSGSEPDARRRHGDDMQWEERVAIWLNA